MYLFTPLPFPKDLPHWTSSFWHILSLWTVSLYGNLLCIISVPSHNIQ